MRRVTYLVRLGGQFFSYTAVHREFWLLGLVALLALVVMLISAGHAVAPYTIYTLF